MQREHVQRAVQIDKDIARIESLLERQGNGDVAVWYQIVSKVDGVMSPDIGDERWKEMSEGIADSVNRVFFEMLDSFKRQLEAELKNL